MKELTQKQQKILEFLAGHVKKYGYPPTMREIGKHFGILWPAARGHLQSLQKKGFIKMNPSISRGIEIIGLRLKHGVMIPVLGNIRAGKPLLAFEETEDHILIDKSLFKAEDAFSLKVKGDSMIDAGIFDGDHVIVKPQKNIENSQIGVVLIGDEATVKRVFKRSGKIILRPENKTMGPVAYEPEEVSIIGRVIGVVRKL